jgi:hypothetical protein
VASTGQYVTGLISANGNVTGGNLVTAGNVYAPAIVNNGTNNTQIELNSTSGIVAVTINGNSTQFKPSGQIELGGVSQVVGGTFAGSGITVAGTQTDIFQNRGGNVTVQVGTGGSIANTWTFTNSGNLLAPGNISAVGNITGNYFIGNGSLLTGISGGGNGQAIINGNSNVRIDVAGGNVIVAVDGVDQVANITSSAVTVTGVIATPTSMSGNVTVPGNVNSVMFGPVEFGNSSIFTMGNTSTFAIPDFSGGGNGFIPNGTKLSNDVGVPGQISYDADYVYVCIAPNTWKRVALSGGY